MYISTFILRLSFTVKKIIIKSVKVLTLEKTLKFIFAVPLIRSFKNSFNDFKVP